MSRSALSIVEHLNNPNTGAKWFYKKRSYSGKMLQTPCFKPSAVIRYLLEQCSPVCSLDEVTVQTGVTRDQLNYNAGKYTPEQEYKLVDFLISKLPDYEAGKVSHHSIFIENYCSISSLKEAFLPIASSVSIEITKEHSFPKTYDTSNKDLDGLMNLVTSRHSHIVLRGPDGSGRTILLHELFSAVSSNELLNFSTVLIKPSDYSTIEEMLTEFTKKLAISVLFKRKPQKKTEEEWYKVGLRRYVNKIEEASLYKLIGHLFSRRNKWLIIVDSDRSWIKSGTSSVARSQREAVLREFINQVKEYSLSNESEVKLMTVSNNSPDIIEDAVIFDMPLENRRAMFEGTLFHNLVNGNAERVLPEVSYRLILLGNILQMPILNLNEHEKEMWAKEALMQTNAKSMDELMVKALSSLLPPEAYRALCILSIPDDDMFKSSLNIVLGMEYEYLNYKGSSDTSTLTIEGWKNAALVHLESLKGILIKKVTLPNPLVRNVQSHSTRSITCNEVCYIVKPIVKQAITEHFNRFSSNLSSIYRAYHYFVGVVSYRQYLLLAATEDKDVIHWDKEQKPRRLAQATFHLTQSIASAQSSNFSRKKLLKEDVIPSANARLNDQGIDWKNNELAFWLMDEVDNLVTAPTKKVLFDRGEMLNYEDRINLSWLLTQEFMNTVTWYGYPRLFEIRASLLFGIINAGRSVKNDFGTLQGVSGPSTLVVNSLQEDSIGLYAEMLWAAFHADRLDIAHTAAEWVKYGLAHPTALRIDEERKRNILNKIEQALFHMHYRSGRNGDALIANMSSIRLIEEQISFNKHNMIMEEYIQKPISTFHDLLNNLASAYSRNLMVYMTEFNIQGMISSIESIEKYTHNVELSLSLDIAKQALSQEHPSHSGKMNEWLLSKHIERIGSEFSLYSSKVSNKKRKGLFGSFRQPNFEQSQEHIKFGLIDIDLAIKPRCEILRSLIRLKQMVDSNVLYDSQTINDIESKFTKKFNYHEGLLEASYKDKKSTDKIQYNETFNYLTTKIAILRYKAITSNGLYGETKNQFIATLKKLMGLSWQVSLPTRYKTKLALEIIRNELFLITDCKCSNNQKDNMLITRRRELEIIRRRLEGIMKSIRKSSNIRAYSLGLIMNWLLAKLNFNEEREIMSMDKLVEVEHSFEYKYRSPELEVMRKGVNPLWIYAL